MNTSIEFEERTSIPPATGSSRINVGKGERIASIVTGTLLSVLSVRKWSTLYGKTAGLAGLMLLKRGVTGYCEVNNAIGRTGVSKRASAIEVKTTFEVNKPREEVFAYWRNFEKLPSFMNHLKDVEVLDEGRSSWRAKIPGGASISWEAVITEEEPGKLIAWASLPGSTIDNAGEVEFNDGADDATIVRACISYRLPGGDLGSMAAKLINPAVERMIKQDLDQFKTLLERGEI